MNHQKFLFPFIFIIVLVNFLYCQNNMLQFTKLKLTLDRLPQGFDGFKIIHLSGLHEKKFGDNNSILISRIRKNEPDMIVITGDLINARQYDIKNTLYLASQISQIAPVYFVTGNHEASTPGFDGIQRSLEENGITVLKNKSVAINKNGDTILLTGIDSSTYIHKSNNRWSTEFLSAELEKALGESRQSDFKILLSHLPEQFPLYAEHQIDLTFSGHAHGGQFRLPFIGALFVPNQGFFPKYTSGKYVLNNSTMVVSRGLGNGSSISQRLFNRPELVIVTLHSTKETAGK